MVEPIALDPAAKHDTLPPAGHSAQDQHARVRAAHAYLDEHMSRRQGNKVLHSHPSPLLWRERDIPIAEILKERRTRPAGVPKRLSVYVATPYCVRTDPPSCGFCLFPHEVYTGTGALNRYLDCLRKEGAMYRDFFREDRLAAIYFGGGTSNIYRAEAYPGLMAIVRETLAAIPEDVEITLEGLPHLFTREKLACMKAVGINRISMGVQQLNDDLIKLSGRAQTSRHVYQALEWCDELGLRTSIDLIFGWPRQTVELMLADLDAIVRTGITHITHYELNVAGRSDFARRKDELPTIEQNRLMFHVAKQFLESSGYRQVTTYDWEKVDAGSSAGLAFEDNMRKPFDYSDGRGVTGADMWGWGFAGVSFFLGDPDAPGWAWMNSARVSEYSSSVEQPRYPTERGFRYEIEDVRMAFLFQSLQNMRIDLKTYRAVFGIDPLEEHRPVWRALLERGWIGVTGEKIELIGDGIYFTALIQALLASKRDEEIRSRLAGH